MSRIGKQPIIIPSGVTVELKDGSITVIGPQGTLSEALSHHVVITSSDKMVMVAPKNFSNRLSRSLWGTYQRLISNMMIGVTKGFSKKLEFNGVGWRCEVKNNTLVLNIGYSHPVEFKIPEGIDIHVEKNMITVTGNSKQRIGQIAAEIRSIRKTEPYKGKGIKYHDEVVRRKAGKQAKGTVA